MEGDTKALYEAIRKSTSYKLAEEDQALLKREELRANRLELEFIKAELVQQDQDIRSTIVVFGGGRLLERSEAEHRLEAARAAVTDHPDDPDRKRNLFIAERLVAKARFYDEAREFARIVSSTCQTDGRRDLVIVTGGGPGVMEAANRGAFDAGAKSIGLNITIPQEQLPNPYITPQLCFQFRYFAIRKLHFMMRARALVAFPGGYGTLDELFEALTLVQTERIDRIPIILFGREYWDGLINWNHLRDEGMIDPRDLDLIEYAETAQEAWEIVVEHNPARAQST